MSKSSTGAKQPCGHCGKRPVQAKDLCSVCYRMVRLYGVPSTGWHDPAKIRERRVAFLWANIDVRGPDECWPWKRKPTAGGYGQLRWLNGQITAHRAVYEVTHGSIPEFPGERTDIDHTCHDPEICKLKAKCPHRLCCNPAHLEAVPASVNRHRGDISRPGNGLVQRHRKCPPGCTCRRHEVHNSKGGSPKCKPGCTCGRHRAAGVKCPPDCTCGRHHRAEVT